MSTWSLAQLLAGLHQNIEHRLEIARKTLGHAGTKGDGSENVWLELFQTYLPTRYRAEKAHVVDSRDKFSQQIDVVIFDRQYSPFIFDHAGQKVIPAESVYAAFEAKQSINVEVIRYAQEKIGSVRSLYRTSLPIPHAGGTYPPKPLNPVIGGILTFKATGTLRSARLSRTHWRLLTWPASWTSAVLPPTGCFRATRTDVTPSRLRDGLPRLFCLN
jgi:hypothetical protein